MRSANAVIAIEGNLEHRVVLTCEHAGSTMPEPWSWPEEDRWLINTHWACDIGAGAFTHKLAGSLGAPAVLSNFSRLLVDPNRPLDSDTLFRKEAEGRRVQLNASINANERNRRLEGFYHPYHDAATDLVGRSTAEIVFGVHSFTSNYEGRSRELEVGILFDRDDELGLALVADLREAGFVAAANEPYSGKEGLAYSPVLHADAFGRHALEIEVRQDIIVDDAFTDRLVTALTAFLS